MKHGGDKLAFEYRIEHTKGVIRIRISKNRQHNGQKKKYKRTNNNLQNMHITKDRVIRTQLKTRSELRCPGRVSKESEAFGNDSIILFSGNIANVTYICANGDGYEKR